ncbi:ABC transporter permease [Streptomyces lonarensis]|uniref:ABC transporter permease n=1 Tax=Streptomyces lonarensis TaxID=700599 RepID=A0A7X6CZH6_9ACTN|nr:ABC transporter permease [Streptomyces lonarensis]NJQ05320.1 ABC transporter permease [Streptomyces lonarensis]
MGRYIIRRLLQFIPTLAGALFLLHYLSSLAVQLNGNPARAMFGDRRPSEAMLAAVQKLYNLDDPCLEQVGNPCFGQFVNRVTSLAQGDLGTNFRGRPVTEIIADSLPLSARLAVIALVVQILIGITAGVFAGLRNKGVIDYAVKISTVVIIAFPVFVLGKVIQTTVNVPVTNALREASWAPDWLGTVFSISYQANSPWLSLLVPGVVLGALGLATTARLTRTSLIENLHADYVRTATAKGMPRRRVIGVHALRNSLIPVVTDLGLSVGVLLSGAVVTEAIFNIPGVGFQLINAIRVGESPVIVSLVTFFVLIYLVVNLLVDLLYAVLDPRIRYE